MTSHGTDDVTGYAGDYVHAAREFLTDWVNDPNSMDPAALQPYQNAENIAAAATGECTIPRTIGIYSQFSLQRIGSLKAVASLILVSIRVNLE